MNYLAKKIISGSESKTSYNSLTKIIDNDESSKRVKDVTQISHFIPISALFLMLKNNFKNGINDVDKYFGRPLDNLVGFLKDRKK